LSMSDLTKSRLADWSQKLGVPVAELEKQFQAAYASVQKLYPEKTPSFWEQRARRLLATKYARQLRPQARAVVGVFFDVGPKIDTNAARARMAKEMWSNPETRAQAIADGLVTPEGTPLDNRPELVPGRKNPNYGKPLKPFYQRTALGFFKKFGEQSIKLTIVSFRGDKADMEIPINTPVTCRLNIRQETQYVMLCTSSTATEIHPSEDPDFAGWNESRTLEMLDSAPIKVSPLALEEYYDEQKELQKSERPLVFAIVEGDLLSTPEQTSTGNYRIELGDIESDIEALPTSGFISEELYEKIKDLGLGSRLILIARLTLGLDLATGERTRVNLNPAAIYVKIPVSKEESLLDFKEVGA